MMTRMPPPPPLPPGVEERFANVDGVRVRYLEGGAGPPLVLIHGLLGYSFSWRLNLEVLAGNSRVYAVDLPGVGFSDRPRGMNASLTASADRMLRFLDEVEVDTADLVATSHGGALALKMALAGAESGRQRVQSLVLAAPANPWSAHGKRLSRALGSTPGRWLVPHLVPLLAPWCAGWFLRRQYGDPRRVPPGTVEGYLAPLSHPGMVNYALQVLRHFNRDLKELGALLPALAGLPVLFLWGTADPIVLPDSIAPLRARLPGSELVELPGVGHLPYEESPEAFNAAVGAFLSRARAAHAHVTIKGSA